MSGTKSMLVSPAVQNYAWGKPGKTSAVADLAAASITGFTRKDDEPYAELWMGTHPKAPCMIPSDGSSLSDWLAKNPAAIGKNVQKTFPTPGQLPYLFKVLSVNKALSIQAHPTKAHAEKLHAEKPDKYPDPNHKPEMAIALTPFEALCGFRPQQEIADFLKSIPEFRELIGASTADSFIAASTESDRLSSLQKCFTALMTSDKAAVQKQLEKLIKRISEKGKPQEGSLDALLLRTNSEFPGDVGCFSIYFFNYMHLQPGEAIFLEANLPHAYLAGDCMECMACSDNVVRAGLTPKFIDVPTLCGMLNYQCKPASDNKFSPRPHPSDKNVTIFSPPVPDFAVDEIKVPSKTSYTVPPVPSASLLLVLKGAASSSGINGEYSMTRGSVVFVAAEEKLELKITSSDGLQAFRAYCDC